MALVIKDRVKETTTTTGTGAVSLGGASSNFVTFSSVLSDGDTTYYAIVDSGNTDFEVGLGTYASSGNTIARTTILSSSNSDAVVDLQLGSKFIFCAFPADKAVVEDATGKVTIDSNVGIESGLIDLKNDGTVSRIKFYCESNNAHAQTVQSAPHSEAATNTLTLPSAGSNLVSDTATQTLTNKTLTSPKINEDVAVTSTATEINLLDGVTATTAELNYTDGVTSNIQTQLDSKVGANYTGDVNITGELLVDSYNETFKKVSSVGATTGYQLSSAAYASKSFSVASQETAPRSVEFKTDGTKMYVVGSTSDTVFQYSLSTAWDVSTASYDSKSFSVASEQTVPDGIRFKPDGTKFYIIGDTPDSVHQYSMSTAWDISTASYDSVTFSVSSQATQAHGIVFKPDGTKFYICDNSADSVFQYALSTAWDLSTASYESKSFSTSPQELSPTGLNFNPDGTKIWILGFGSDLVLQYSLSTAWDVSTTSYDSVSFSVATQTANPYDFTFGDSGTKFYVVEVSNDSVYQYDWSTTTYSTTFDCENANVFETELDANTTVVFSNPPAAGTATDSTAYAMSLKVVQDSGASGYTITWPTSVDWPAATAPTLTATASAVDQFVFYTYDGGTTWYGFTAGQALG